MSNSIIPHLLSDSPPPIAGNIEEDYDDEFGDFTGTGDLSFDNDNSSTSSTPKNSKQNSHAFELNPNSCQLDPDDETLINNLKNELPTKNYINILDHIENNTSKIENVVKLEEKLTYKNEITLLPKEDSENVTGSSISHKEGDYECNGFKGSLEDETCISKEGFNYEDLNGVLDLNQEILGKKEICKNFLINEDAKNTVEFDSPKEISCNGVDANKDYNDNSIKKLGINLETSDEEKTRSIEIDEVKVTENNIEGIEVLDSLAKVELNDSDWNFGDSNTIPITDNKVLEKLDVPWQLNEDDFTEKTEETHNQLDLSQIPQHSNFVSNEIVKNESNSDDFDQFADFTSFQSTSKDPDFQHFPPPEQEPNEINETNVDEFADFANHSSFNQLHDKNDDFDDFASYSTSANKPQDEFACRNPKEALEKSKILLEKMFPCQTLEEDDYLQCDFTTENPVFQNLKDVTETNAVSYQWEKSTARKNLLKTLNIDIRNILYGPSWNAGIPIFAANLCSTPLEPIKTDLPLQTPPIKENQTPPDSSSISTVVPMAEFDWNSSGLTNPLSSFKNTDQDATTPGSTDEIRSSPVKELDESTNIPVIADNSPDDLSDYQMVEETLVEDDFSDFASCQPKIEVDSDWNRTILPLRESHISFQSSNNLNEISKPIIENTAAFYNLDLDLLEPKQVSQTVAVPLNDFQEYDLFESEDKLYLERRQSKSSDVSKADDSDELSHPQSSSAGSFDIPDPVAEPEDEFSDFHSSMPPQPELTKQPLSLPQVLEPAVLQPTPVNQPVTRIEWPEPGLDEEEVNRIVLGCLTKTTSLEKAGTDPKQNTHNADEDEWSDFVSVKGSVKSRTSTPDLPLSVFNLGNIQPVKAPTPLITPNGLMCSPVKTMSPDMISRPKSMQNYPQQHPFITSQAFEALNSRKNVMSFRSFEGATSSIQPNLQYDNYQSSNQLVNNTEDDDWGEFVSATNAPVTTNNLNPVQSSSHIFTNPSHNMATLNKKAPSQQYFNSRSTVVRQERQNIPTISALPDLDFVSPKARSMRK